MPGRIFGPCGCVRNTPSIRVIEGYAAEALLTEGDAVTGLQLRKADDPAAAPVIIASRAIVLATGGIGHLYAVTTNPAEASGIGLAIAARAGAVIADPEFVQFHPTALNVGRDPAPLATEALRGEGASVMYLAVDGQLAGLLAVSDPVKGSTPEALAATAPPVTPAGLRPLVADEGPGDEPEVVVMMPSAS